MKIEIYPKQEEIFAQLQQSKNAIIWSKIIADMETPTSVMSKLLDSSPCFLLESVHGGENRGRYSLIGLYPDKLWRCEDGVAAIASYNAQGAIGEFIAQTLPPLESLQAQLDEIAMIIPPQLPSMAAGMIGYFGYDMIKMVEKIPHNNPDPINIPQALLMRPKLMLIFDNIDGVVYASAPIWADSADFKLGYDAACSLIQQTLNKLISTPAKNTCFTLEDAPDLEFSANMNEAEYGQMVEKAKEYIMAGDIFQVVPSQRFTAKFNAQPFSLYRALRNLNPSPFLFYLQMPNFSLVGSSPEILVRLRDEKITIRPIAGTRPRGATPAQDLEFEADLIADSKEIAEHQMLLDLGRNDVGKCAQAGTVKVTQTMGIERYSHVMHIVSNVEGIRLKGKSAVECLMAGFPAGTVSGAPKIRAMEIIDELEPVARSFYAGGVGYFSASGWLDSCITLRTALLKDGMIYVQAGGGVVAGSDASAEYQESCNKAKAIMKAASIAAQFEETQIN